MKLALAQINTVVGDFTGNVRKVAAAVKKARAAGVDLLAFPELTLTGYPPRDLLDLPEFVTKNLAALEQVARLAQGITIVVGYVGSAEGAGRKALVNAAAVCQEGRVVATYAKRLVPSYDVFDEGRHFASGSDLPESGLGIFEMKGEKIGISICEDAWNDQAFWEKRIYPNDPIEEQVRAGATCLLNISASPFVRGKPQFRRKMFQSLARRHSVPFFYVNLVGANDELIFDGGSLGFDAQGRLVALGKIFAEDLVIIDTKNLSVCEEALESDVAEISEALILGVRDYVRKCGFKKVVLGLSGGIDSALVATLAARALGAKNVLGVLMPSPFSSRGSIDDSKQLARNLGIPTRTIPIASVYQAYRKILQSKPRPDLTDENLQARIRGNILMALSNRYGHLVLSTGNKSELAVGYCTLYGDMSGGLAVISDLLKTTVYEVARHIVASHLNQKKRSIPEPIFTKPPSAELRPNQTDQDSLPPYDVLDPILSALVEEMKSESEIIAMGFEPKTVRRIVRLVEHNEYKRRQAAPGLKVTSKAFGIGRRFPIARS